MKKSSNSRNGVIHLYNPTKEGLGLYDIHYINAYKKKNITKKYQITNQIERLSA
tara:strand:+ start:57 stop:218 length:162 start_codon:yes stop_codon:yes gene_type:complete